MKTRPITLIMDADGVFVDFVGGVLRETLKLKGRSIAPESLPDWQIFGRLEQLAGTGTKKALHDRIKLPGWCRDLEPTPGADAALEQLLALEQDGVLHLLIATSPWDSSPTWMHERAGWFEERGLHRHRVVHTAIKGLLRGDMFVDDKASHVADWRDANRQGAGYVWDTPHNRAEALHLTRLSSWDALFDAIVKRVRRL